MKNVLAVIVGLISAMVTFLLIEMLSASIYPPPENFDMRNAKAMKAHVASMPNSVFLIILAGYVIGSFIAGFVIGKISNSSSKWLPIIAGIILIIGAILNLMAIPHPLWFAVINVLVYVPVAVMGYSFAGRRHNR